MSKKQHTNSGMLRVAGALVLFLFGLGTVKADKDDSYYVSGTGNPNVYEAMYWKDAENVLQDLSKFSALYVKYHNCAWTWNQRKNDEDEGVAENDYWYIGKIPPMAANVAFSLYGQLKTKSGSFKGCTQDTFINSFYTNSGFTAFASAMKSAGVTGFSTSSVTSYTADCQGGVGVGCDASGGFAMHRYKSSICDPQNVTSVSNDLYYVNLAMKNAQCIQIYNSYKSSSYSSSSNDDDGASYYSSTPLALLYNSSACFYQNFFSPDGTCPDPFGRISYYKSNFYKEIQKSKAQRPVSLYKQQMEYEEKISAGRTKGEIGAFLLATAIVVVLCDKILYDCIKPMFWKKSDGLEKASTYRYDDGDDKSTTVQSQRSAGSDGNDTRFM